MDGQNISFYVGDEFCAWIEGSGAKLLASLRSATRLRKSPQGILMSTAGDPMKQERPGYKLYSAYIKGKPSNTIEGFEAMLKRKSLFVWFQAKDINCDLKDWTAFK